MKIDLAFSKATARPIVTIPQATGGITLATDKKCGCSFAEVWKDLSIEGDKAGVNAVLLVHCFNQFQGLRDVLGELLEHPNRKSIRARAADLYHRAGEVEDG